MQIVSTDYLLEVCPYLYQDTVERLSKANLLSGQTFSAVIGWKVVQTEKGIKIVEPVFNAERLHSLGIGGTCHECHEYKPEVDHSVGDYWCNLCSENATY